ncbi:MAG: DUF4259 domain-containing protein [Anaerolineales bacterium]|jgi:hypothetical protein
MGAWGTGSFENDDALDWVFELEDARNFQILADAFETILDQKDEYLEAPDCSIAICAAEVTAGLLGNPADDLPEEVMEWMEGQPDPSEVLLKLAKNALNAILKKSELKELWQETDDYDEWREIVLDIRDRLEE